MGIKDKLSNLKNNNAKFLANTSWLIFDKVFHMILSLIIMSITARYLGTSNYGLLNYGLSFVNIFTSVSKLGIDAILVNELIKEKSDSNKLIGTTIALRLASGFLSIILTGLFVAVLKPGDMVILAISLIQGVSLLFVAFDTIDYYFQSMLKSKYSAVAKSVSYVVVCIVRLILIILKANIIWFAAATVVDAAAIGAGLLIFYKKENGTGFHFSKETAKYLIKNASPFILANMLVVVYTQMDRIMIGSLSNDSQVGLYSAAINIANMWVFIPISIIDSARPIIMRYRFDENNEKYIRRYTQLTSAVIWISIAAGIVFTLIPGLFIRILYGSDFMDAVPILMILIWSRMFSLLGTTRSIWLICEGLSKYVKWFVGIGACINVVLNFMWIPQYYAVGASVATLITEIVGAVILPLFFTKTRPIYKILKNSLIMNFKS